MATVTPAQTCVYAHANCLSERHSADFIEACGQAAWVAACRVQPAICGLQESSEPGTGMDPALAPKAVTMCTASLVATKIPSCSRYQDFCMA